MTVILTGRDLARDEVVRVAREGEAVRLDEAAIETMRASRAVVERALARHEAVYGASTGVGVLKRVAVSPEDASRYAKRLIRHHLVGQGPRAREDVVRATMLRLANAFASGVVGVRPVLAERLVRALNSGETPRVRTLGSVGQADLAPMADLADALFADVELAAGEGLALVSGNAFSTGWSALAIADAAGLLDALETAGAMSLEAFAVNPGMLHPAIADVRPYPGLRRVLATLGELLAGSFLLGGAAARGLQDPLSFRNLPQVQGACRDALAHVEEQLAIELNASQGNPIVVPSEDRLVSVANFEILPLAAAVDYLRILLASALSVASERIVKLLEAPWSGLPTGLAPPSRLRDGAAEDVAAEDVAGGPAEAGMSYLGIVSQSLAAEARLLAQPVSFEMASTSHAEGIEDRTVLAPLGARRLDEMVDLGRRIVTIELAVAAQAAELRGLAPRGRGTAAASALVRRTVPYLDAGDAVPDVEPLVAVVAAGELAPARLPA